ncbi:hypothetical protein [Enhydrobacter sp.]|jgi:hypothetical protein|uniref:phage head-tail joining protein n=1 Tax=Enhydrobacter sp. TaxID=1894999 RepID=UPI002629E602|nr:hypothetical protein [Enhydrobacter sp.]WIM10595.1 MAG: hypothetical protein OJF58_001551 [Enhydrobacter sp.]
MTSLADLQLWRDSLFAARMRGVLSVKDQNGETVVYKSDSEMAAAIAACDREIAALSGRPVNTIVFRTSKGL